MAKAERRKTELSAHWFTPYAPAAAMDSTGWGQNQNLVSTSCKYALNGFINLNSMA